MADFRIIACVTVAMMAIAFPSSSFGQELKSEQDYVQTAATKVIMIKVCGISTVKDGDGTDIDLTNSLGRDIALAQKVGGRTYDEVERDILKGATDQNTLNEQMGINFCAQMELMRKLYELTSPK